MKHYFVVVSGALVALAAWTACVGDGSSATSTTDKQGEQNQACFANGTCFAGLACVNSVCVAVGGNDAAMTSSSSSSTGGAASSTSSSSSSSSGAPITADDCRQLGLGASPSCPFQAFDAGDRDPVCTGGVATSACCPGAGCQAPGSPCKATYDADNTQTLPPITCFSDAECPANEQCCTSGSFVTANSGECAAYEVTFDSAPACIKAADCPALTHLCVPADAGRSTCASNETCQTAVFDVLGADGVQYSKAVGLCTD